jgi:hypothetical protein
VHKKLFNALYILNIVSQALFTLVIPAALLYGITWLLVLKLSLPEWLYAIALVLGFVLGFISMIKFILTSMAGLERLEKEQKDKKKNDENGQ